MHPSIAQFPSESFYGRRLKNGVKSDERRPPPTYSWPEAAMPVAFEPVERAAKVQATQDGDEERRGQSYTNHAEVRKVAEVLYQLFGDVDKSMFNPGARVGPGDVGIVTPYSAQVEEIRADLRHRGFPVSRSRYQPADAAEGGVDNFIEIASVDGFQGREKEVIIFSAVRSNTTGSVGFLSDWRRLNVMITRARRGIIVIGDRRTLRYDHVWGTWLAWAENRGLVRGEAAKRNGYQPRMLSDTMLGDVSLEEYLNLEAEDEVITESTTDGGWAVAPQEPEAGGANAPGEAGPTKEEKKKKKKKQKDDAWGFDDSGWESLMNDGKQSSSDSDSSDDDWGRPAVAAPAAAPKPKPKPVQVKVELKVAPAKASSPNFGHKSKKGGRPVSPSQEKYFPSFVRGYDPSLVPPLLLPMRAEEADAALQDENERLLLQSEREHRGSHNHGAAGLRHGQVKLLKKKPSSRGKQHQSQYQHQNRSKHKDSNFNRSPNTHRPNLVLMKKGSNVPSQAFGGGNPSSTDRRPYGDVRVLGKQ